MTYDVKKYFKYAFIMLKMNAFNAEKTLPCIASLSPASCGRFLYFLGGFLYKFLLNASSSAQKPLSSPARGRGRGRGGAEQPELLSAEC